MNCTFRKYLLFRLKPEHYCKYDSHTIAFSRVCWRERQSPTSSFCFGFFFFLFSLYIFMFRFLFCHFWYFLFRLIFLYSHFVFFCTFIFLYFHFFVLSFCWSENINAKSNLFFQAINLFFTSNQENYRLANYVETICFSSLALKWFITNSYIFIFGLVYPR